MEKSNKIKDRDIKLKKKLYTLSKDKLPFLILLIGGSSNFFTTLILKKEAESSIFDSYSVFVTYIGIISSFGLIGLDQVFLRLCKVQKGKVYVGKNVIHGLVATIFLSPFLLSIYFYNKTEIISIGNFIFTGICVNIFLFAYNIFRITANYSISQIIKNSFKLVLAILFISPYLFKLDNEINYSLIFNSFVLFLIISSIILLLSIAQKITLTREKTSQFKEYFFSMFFNLLIITLMGYGERIIILEDLGSQEFSKYYYYSTIFLFPLTMLQQYVGFKELVTFKKSKLSKKKVLNKLRQLSLISSTILFFIYIILIIDNGNFFKVDIKEDFLILIAISILGICKLNYGLFSALIGAVGKVKEFKHLNYITFSLCLLGLCILKVVGVSIFLVVVLLVIIFLVRSFYIFLKYVSKQKT